MKEDRERPEYSIAIDAILIDGEDGALIKLQTSASEVNVLMRLEEVARLGEIVDATWSDRKSLQLGRCLGSPAYWSCEDGIVSVLVGHDDEAWDVGVFLPEASLVELEDEVTRLIEGLRQR